MNSSFLRILPFAFAAAPTLGCTLDAGLLEQDGLSDYHTTLDQRDLVAYYEGGRYGDVLVDCAMRSSACVVRDEAGDVLSTECGLQAPAKYCTFEELPLIGMEHSEPSVDDVMARLVISKAQPWIGARFRQYLDDAPSIILRMFASVPAVMIADNISPAHYHTGSGVIYLNPEFLALTDEERGSLAPAPDLRSPNPSDFEFSVAATFIVGDTPINELPEGRQRAEYNRLNFSLLLFHELFHAVDFFQPHNLSTLDETLSTWDNIPDVVISQRLGTHFPLQSELWTRLSRSYYYGVAQGEGTRHLSALQAYDAFVEDHASHPYAYVGIAEDAARLFDTLMMKHYFDADEVTFFTDQKEGSPCEGQVAVAIRNRLGDPNVLERAKFVLKFAFPEMMMDRPISPPRYEIRSECEQ